MITRVILILFLYASQLSAFQMITGGILSVNDFSNDSNCVALYRLESGAITTDSKSSNTLTNNNTVTNSTSLYREGLASAEFNTTSNQSLTRTDANLVSGFPYKNGESNTNVSAAFWFRMDSGSADDVLVSKHDSGGYYSFIFTLNSSNALSLRIGYNSGASEEIVLTHGTTLSTGVWYHATFTYDGTSKAAAIRLKDGSCETLGTDSTGTSTNTASIDTGSLRIGGLTSSNYFDGFLDEVVIFNDILTSDEATLICKGHYR